MGVDFTYLVRDRKGASSNVTLHADDGFTLANYLLAAAAAADIIQAIAQGGIVTASLRVNVPLVGMSSPLAASDVEEGARFVFRTPSGYVVENRIPTFNEALIVDMSRQVDLADLAVLDYVNMMVDGFDTIDNIAADDTFKFTDYRYQEQILGLDSALEDFKKSRKTGS